MFEMVNTTQRGGIFMGSAILFTLSAVLLKFIYERFNGKLHDAVLAPNKERA